MQRDEWSRIALAWFLRFFYRVAFVLGWTLVLGLFVSRYGIAALPFLFALIAVFTIIGSFLYSLFIHRFAKEDMIIGSIFVIGVCLFLSTQLYENLVLFFSLLVVVVSIFLMQLKILLDGYIEEMFSALESERAFPLIEAADTIGGIIAGLAIAILSSFFEPHRFIYLWIGVIFLIIPVLLYHQSLADKERLFEDSRRLVKAPGILTKFKETLVNKRYSLYIRGLFLIVLFQWFLFNLLEFQYTKAVYQNVSHVVLEAGSGFEHAFIHDLGILFILFSSSALLIQFFLGSRLFNYLGIFGTMLIHPIVTIFSLFGISMSFSFGTAVLAKNNFTITSVLYTNAYHSSYYGIRENSRAYARELLEGIVRPVGAIFGTLFLLSLQYFFSGAALVLSVNILMLLAACGMFYVMYLQQERYTQLAINDLRSSSEKAVRMNAIDILSQRGHGSAIVHLVRILRDDRESLSMKVAALRALAELQNSEVLEDILSCLKSSKSELRVAALDTLSTFKFLLNGPSKNLYLKSQVIEALKDLYVREKSDEVLQKLINIMSLLSGVSTVEFLLTVLQSRSLSHKSEAILALRRFDDANLTGFVVPYLRSNNLSLRISAAISLASNQSCRASAMGIVSTFLHSSCARKIALALYAIGELGLVTEKALCQRFLKSKNEMLRAEAAIALCRMGYTSSVTTLIDLLLRGGVSVQRILKRRIANLDVRIYKNIDKIVRGMVFEEIERLLPDKSTNLESLDAPT
ncbi:hypothetical protein HY605_01135, partial [Candidatus Peregrinibacteria bacterium]|nr:hypothetical protein [Candidatus Peregrinibacteria bacterium]